MAQRFYEPIARIFTNAGAVGVGYKYYFYQTGTTTPVTTYQDDGLTVANTNPVISDANGRFSEIWYSDLSQLKLVVKDSSDNTIETVDPVGSTSAAISLNDFDVRPTSYWGATAGTSTAYTLVANPTISAYANTQTFVVQVHLDCGDNPTLAIDGLSALSWKKYTQQGTKVNLKANDLRATQRYFCINDGVDIVVLNPSSLPILSGSTTALTIATGAITITNNSSSYVVDTEGSASTDDLDTISGGQDGQIIFINIANNSRDITLRSGVGNIVNPTGLNITLGNTNDIAVLRYNGTNWIIVSVNYSDAEPVRLIETKTASNDPQIDFTSGINSSFSSYRVKLINVLPSTDAVYLGMRYSTDGGSTFATTSYLNTGIYTPSSGGVFDDFGTTDRIVLTDDGSASSNRTVDNGSSNSVDGWIEIPNPSNSSKYKSTESRVTYNANGGDFVQYISGGTYRGATTAINAFRFLFSSGNIASGTFKLYGIK